MSGDPDGPYLPERYRRHVQAKKQRRLRNRILGILAVLLAAAGIYLAFGGILQGAPPAVPGPAAATPAPSPAAVPTPQVPNVTPTVTPQIARGSGMSSQNATGMLSLENALALFFPEYPPEAYTLVEVNLTGRYADRDLYEFRIRAAGSSPAAAPFTIFMDAVTGEPYTPGQDRARITADQARDLARNLFPTIPADRITVRYTETPSPARAWKVILFKENRTSLSGSLDADTGQLQSFAVPVNLSGRKAEPALSLQAAQDRAGHFITDHNGPVSVTLTGTSLTSLQSPAGPVAGQYVFTFSRVVQDIPCEADGFTVGVDAAGGEVTGYERRWAAPENAFAVAAEPLVTRHVATFAILQKAQEKYPGATGLTIVSAEIRWHDQHPPEITPRPGSIPLAWRVGFDDDYIRAQPGALPATGWVDTQTGRILDLQYQH